MYGYLAFISNEPGAGCNRCRSQMFLIYPWRASNSIFLISGDRNRVVSAQIVGENRTFQSTLLQGVVKIGVARNTADFHDFAVRGRLNVPLKEGLEWQRVVACI